MAATTEIQWTNSTWTPIRARNLKTGKVGWHCEHATTGCEFCYSEGFNKRLGTGLDFKPGHRKDVEIFLDDDMLLAPLRWKKPRMIFVCSMTDLFADFVSDEFIDKMFAVMALCPQHTFQVLTKRAGRMREYFDASRYMKIVHAAAKFDLSKFGDFIPLPPRLPLPNLWLGVSAERQEEANERIPELQKTPAVVRFVSLEPLLGPIDLTVFSAVDSDWNPRAAPIANLMGLHWIIVGGESGKNARPMHPDWARAVRDQCTGAGVAFFFKQWGEWTPHKPAAGGDLGGDVRFGKVRIVHPTGQSDVEVSIATGGRNTIPGSRYMMRVGKKASGRLLDGVEHNGMPRQTKRAAP